VNTLEGWISLHRSIQEHWLYQERRVFSKYEAWIDMIMMASHKDNRFLLGKELVEVKRGSFITSELKLMDRWRWSKAKVRNFLNLLEEDKMILKKSDKKKTTLTIVNYNDYQDGETTQRPQKDHTETTKRPQKDTINNVNNDNNVNNKDIEYSMQNIIDAWNDLKLTQIKSIKPNTNRFKLLNVRVREYGESEVIKAIETIKHCPFLLGQSQSGWIITFDWFIKPNNFLKVLEGTYMNNGASDKAKNKNNQNLQGAYKSVSNDDLENLLINKRDRSRSEDSI